MLNRFPKKEGIKSEALKGVSEPKRLAASVKQG